MVPFRYLVREIDSRLGPTAHLELLSVSATSGVVPRSTLTNAEPRADNLFHYKLAQAGDIVVNRMSAFQGALGLARQDGIVSPDYAVLRCTASADPGFLSYMMRSAWFVGHMTARLRGIGSPTNSSVRTPRISIDELGGVGVPVPAVQEQRHIADFLDDRIDRIDRIITARRGQIDSNREHLRSALEDEFDGGFDRIRASRVMRVLPGFAFPSEQFSHDYGDIRLLRGINVGVGSLRWDESVYWPHGRLAEVRDFLLSEGDIVLGMDRPWIGGGLRIAQVDRADGRPLLLQRVAKLFSNGALRPRFIYWSYQSERFRQQVESDLTGLSVPHLSGEQILSFQMPALTHAQQDSLIDRLDAMQAEVERADRYLVGCIELLNEYKQSLITAAVTGELDVTTAGSSIPGWGAR